MSDIKIKIQMHLEILETKQQEINVAKKAIKRSTVWSNTERYRLNMEMLTWAVNTDSLFRKVSSRYRKEKYKFEKSCEGDIEQGILLGLYYAFNCYKHNMKLLSIENVRLIDFIETENTKFSIASNEWLKSTHLLNEGKYQFYVDYLEGKSVYETFNYAVSFLKKQSILINREI